MYTTATDHTKGSCISTIILGWISTKLLKVWDLKGRDERQTEMVQSFTVNDQIRHGGHGQLSTVREVDAFE